MRQTHSKPRWQLLLSCLLLAGLPKLFPPPPAAAMSSARCALDPACAALLRSGVTQVVAAPTTPVVSSTTIVTTGTGITLSDIAAPVTIVGVGTAAWYYWNQAQNQKAQNLARQRFYQTHCPNPANDPLCGSAIDISFISPNNSNRLLAYRLGQGYEWVAYKIEDVLYDAGDGKGLQNWGPGFWFQTPDGRWHLGPGMDVKTLVVTPVNAPTWENWPEVARATAVGLLTPDDWAGLISAMPVGGTLYAGQTIRAPQIIIPGADTDDPNTPLIDERLPRVVTPSYTLPAAPPVPTPTPTLSPEPTPTTEPTPSPEPLPSPSPTLPPPPPPLPLPNPSPTPTPVPSPSPTPPPPQNDDDFWKQFPPGQKRKLKWLINKGILKEEEVRKGRFGTVEPKTGCFYIELLRHLGDDDDGEIDPTVVAKAADYASDVTGSPGDLIAVAPDGDAGYYDGLVRANGEVVRLKLEPIGSVVEAKYGYSWLRKFIRRNVINRNPELIRDDTPKTKEEWSKYNKMRNQINREARVANKCRLRYFLSFSNEKAYLSAQELFTGGNRVVFYSVDSHHIEYIEF